MFAWSSNYMTEIGRERRTVPSTVSLPATTTLFMTALKERPIRKHHRKPAVSTNHHATREIDFVLECAGAEHVYVCGDFNAWRPTGLPMIGNPDAGLWEKRLVLPPGRYEYKFFVDGKWLHDPDARENVPNPHGSLNSVLEVRL